MVEMIANLQDYFYNTYLENLLVLYLIVATMLLNQLKMVSLRDHYWDTKLDVMIIHNNEQFSYLLSNFKQLNWQNFLFIYHGISLRLDRI